MRMSEKMDYYAVLGVEVSSSHAEIKSAFRQMAIRYHPDKNIHNREDAEIRFKLIHDAYEILSNPELRARYNASYKRRCMQPTSSNYDVDVDESGISIHQMSVRTLVDIEAAFQQDVTHFTHE